MPLGLDQSRFLSDKIRRHERDITAKDERIVSLETENAMLYLRLARLQGVVEGYREELQDIREISEEREKAWLMLQMKTTGYRKDLQDLRQALSTLRQLFQSTMLSVQQELQRGLTFVKRERHSADNQMSMLGTLQEQISSLQTMLEDVSNRHAREKKRRQELHNTLMELRGNIRVHCRVRPIMDFDCGQEDPARLGQPGMKSEPVVHYVDEENVLVRTTKHNKVFEYERVFSNDSNQDIVFDEVQPMLTSLLDGYNVAIMAYGQTGSGKTHTMLGSHRNDDYNLSNEPHPDEGIVPRATRELFRIISEKPAGCHMVEVSLVEIYNNDIRDLLSGAQATKHDVVTGSDGGQSIPTVVSKHVDSIFDVMTIVQLGLRTRRESATLVHDHSSRSHLIVTLTVCTKAPSFFAPLTTSSQSDTTAHAIPPPSPTRKLRQGSSSSRPQSPRPASPSTTPRTASPGVIRTKLQLVDLAGSECVGMSGVTGAALREASHINKSLSALADVLGALAEHRSHVPYRNSRLTHFLQDSIGGDAKLLVMLCVAPAQRYITESLQCLGFGQRARQVQRGQTKRRLPTSAEKVGESRSRTIIAHR